MAVNIHIEPKEGEGIERALRRFRRKVDKYKILDEYKESLVFKKPSEVRREKRKRRPR